MARYIPVVETAKLVRNALKAEFPGIKFSVHSKATSTSINISWVDGPIRSAVDAIVEQFKGSDFDGVTDTRYSRTSTLNGEQVRFGANFIPTRRKMSRVFVETVIAQFCKRHNVPSTIEVRGKEQDAEPYTFDRPRWLEEELRNLLNNTDAKDMHNVYASFDESQTQEAREEQERARQERRQREREYWAEQERKRQEQERASLRRSVPFTSKSDALEYLGLGFNATREDVVQAFRAKVKAASDGKGGFAGDMDLLTKAKKRALQ